MRQIKLSHVVCAFTLATFSVIAYTCFHPTDSFFALSVLMFFVCMFLPMILVYGDKVIFDFTKDTISYTEKELDKACLESFEKGYKKAMEELNGGTKCP